MIGFARLQGMMRVMRFARLTRRAVGVLLAVLLLLLAMGAAGLAVVAELNANTERIIALQRKIAAYRQIQHDATSGLFSVASAVLSAEPATLATALRQLSQFGYDLERLEFVAQDESKLLEALRADQRQFENVVTQIVALIRARQADEARQLMDERIRPLAQRMERLSDQMVTEAEARMVDAIADSSHAYDVSRVVVVAFVLVGAGLALFLGHAISWSMVGPVIDRLLHAILPSSAVAELTKTNRVQPRRYDNVVVLFVDVVDFTRYCDEHTPEEVVANLQLLVEDFESLAIKHGLEKIKTWGDGLLATGNLLVAHPDPVMASIVLARSLATAALAQPPCWQIRAGIHEGPVVAGVVGRSKFSFDLWGDTVNVAARLAAYGGSGIHLSAEAWARVNERCGGEPLGNIPLKGKALIPVYRLDFTA